MDKSMKLATLGTQDKDEDKPKQKRQHNMSSTPLGPKKTQIM